MKICVAIDGPAAAGKSTVAKKVAEILGYTYIDTGAMYRAFTWYCMEKGVDCQNEAACIALIPEVTIKLRPNGLVLCNDIDVTREIREPRVSGNVSYIASYKDIRLFLVEQQRKMAAKHSVIMDGRDIGTYVLPHAEVKIFMIASAEERAHRRFIENQEKGIPTTLEDIIADVKKRDTIDSTRAFAPLKPADDSILLDTTKLTIDEVVEEVIEEVVEEPTEAVEETPATEE